ncbi:VWA domain-containing protein [Oerskovia sp. Sa1BUA8]|uniref:VWA domain-containing protein n=2 Tax=Oerskovia TaxID=162491 RepID=A0A9D5UFN6_9CELL|nr:MULTISPECIES: VWA domain-containing protein [Oerskovia]MBD7981582.1 VWA domain-containing protein [Oerskovia merdavium]MBE7702201.1 VWA domain-containing protein [Oerskovia douganii]
MADATSTHLSMLLDRSGSMQSIKAATIAGFDEFMLEQRGVTGRCTVTLAQFDSEYEEVYADRDVATVPSLDLQPRGTTALLDSIARLVHSTSVRIAQLPEDQRPATVIVGIMTDGHENASKEYTHAAIKALVTERETVFGWTFLYMGANQDAIEVGESIGVARERSLTYEGVSAGAAYGAASASMARLRTGVADGAAPAVARDTFAGFTAAERDLAAGNGSPAGRVRTARPAPAVARPAAPPAVPTARLTESELVAWLTQWRDTTSATSIGDRATYGGRKLIDAQVAGHDVFLNADTSRGAVEQLLAHAARGPLVWSAITNRNGVVNKITFQPDGARTPGWYCYLTAAQAGEGRL